MNLKYCTITGADDNTPHSDMLALQNRWPHVEWGILVGNEDNCGHPRWPSNYWIADMLVATDSERNYVRRAIHLCGAPLRELLLGRIHDRFMPYAVLSRVRGDQGGVAVQLNTHGERHDLSVAGIELIRDLGLTPIVQMDGQNTHIFTALRKACRNVRVIFDMSHGTGVLTKDWPFPIAGVHCTYAGGLSPDNIGRQLELISDAAGDVEVSIDMETHVRTRGTNGDVLDLSKVQTCLIESRRYIRPVAGG